jgi:deoxyribodipyrimidine photo-lyase
VSLAGLPIDHGVPPILGMKGGPWAPERPVFGTVCYMSSESARKKLRLDRYLSRYAPGERQLSLV